MKEEITHWYLSHKEQFGKYCTFVGSILTYRFPNYPDQGTGKLFPKPVPEANKPMALAQPPKAISMGGKKPTTAVVSKLASRLVTKTTPTTATTGDDLAVPPSRFLGGVHEGCVIILLVLLISLACSHTPAFGKEKMNQKISHRSMTLQWCGKYFNQKLNQRYSVCSNVCPNSRYVAHWMLFCELS